MDGEPLVFRNSTRKGWSLVQFGVAPILVGGVLTYISYEPPRFNPLTEKVESRYQPWPLLILGTFGLLTIAAGLWLVLDRAPKLTVDGRGITDHTCPGGERHFAWASIQEVDWRTTGRDNLGTELTLYVRGSGGDVSTHTIDTTNLEGGPVRVGPEVKARWLRFAPPGAGGAAGPSTGPGPT